MVSGPPGRPGAPGPAEYACAQAWAALTAAHARVSGLLAAALARECGLSVTEFEILLHADHAAGEPLRQAELNLAVALTQPALSRAVSRLAERGLLARAGTPEDGRGVLISVTPRGREVLGRAVPVHAQVIRTALLDRLTKAQELALTGALSRIAETVPKVLSHDITSE